MHCPAFWQEGCFKFSRIGRSRVAVFRRRTFRACGLPWPPSILSLQRGGDREAMFKMGFRAVAAGGTASTMPIGAGRLLYRAGGLPFLSPLPCISYLCMHLLILFFCILLIRKVELATHEQVLLTLTHSTLLFKCLFRIAAA